jgi:hypothetical protein
MPQSVNGSIREIKSRSCHRPFPVVPNVRDADPRVWISEDPLDSRECILHGAFDDRFDRTTLRARESQRTPGARRFTRRHVATSERIAALAEPRHKRESRGPAIRAAKGGRPMLWPAVMEIDALASGAAIKIGNRLR